MIRFIIKHRYRDSFSDASGERFDTLLIDVPELEAMLKRGGYGPSGYDLHELAGVEIVEDEGGQ